MLQLLLLSAVPLVTGHGGMLWPPAWQDGAGVPLNKITDLFVYSDPAVKDPSSGRTVKSIRSWLTDQAYLGGHGEEYHGVGIVTNPECEKKKFCRKEKTPWAAPGTAPNLGGGCGIFGGNPYGCPAGNDTRPPGSSCGQFLPPRGAFSFGSSALDMDFPQARNTKWKVGSKQKVAWVSAGGHDGGYTYRLCKMPAQGKQGLTEECFAKNVLKFANKITKVRDVEKPGAFESYEKIDKIKGTYPEGSAWRPVGPRQKPRKEGLLRVDKVLVPFDLPEGDYVLSFRWDAGWPPQVWVSCANVKLVH